MQFIGGDEMLVNGVAAASANSVPQSFIQATTQLAIFAWLDDWM